MIHVRGFVGLVRLHWLSSMFSRFELMIDLRAPCYQRSQVPVPPVVRGVQAVVLAGELKVNNITYSYTSGCS